MVGTVAMIKVGGGVGYGVGSFVGHIAVHVVTPLQ